MVKELKQQDFFQFDDFPLAVARRDPQPVFPRHKHQFTELVVVTRGTAVHVIDDMSFPITFGDTFVLSSNREHEFCDMDNLALINIIFDPEKLGVDKLDTNDLPGFKALFMLEPEYRLSHRFASRLRIAGDDLQKTIDLTNELEKEITEAGPGFKLIATAVFMQLLYHLSRCYGQGISKTPQSESLLQIAKAINYLEKNYQEDIDFENLSRIACMSKRNFQRAFKKSMGCSARDHLLNMRLKHAAVLLQEKSVSINEVSFNSGFADSNYFTKQFKKKYGITPRSYKDTWQKL
jgi:AraC-like DNA-binding protein